jgi:Bacteriophage probable baseplate hub protein
MSAIPIYSGQDFYVPSFRVELNDRTLGPAVVRDITKVTYKDNIEEVDSFEVTINNWDADKLAFKYSDQDLFVPGKELRLSMGYYGRDELRKMIDGEVTSLRP